MTRAEPPAEAPTPSTWDYCQAWADLLIQHHVRDLEESRQQDTSPLLDEGQAVVFLGHERPLVGALIAAALYERITTLGSSLADPRYVRLAAPEDEGVTGTLRQSAYGALEHSPDSAESAQAELMRTGISTHPDDRLRWERVRAAALAVVDDAARMRPYDLSRPAADGSGPYWSWGTTIEDILISEHRQRQHDRLVDIYGDED